MCLAHMKGSSPVVNFISPPFGKETVIYEFRIIIVSLSEILTE